MLNNVGINLSRLLNMPRSFLFVYFILCGYVMVGQRSTEIDSTYITSYGDEFVFKLNVGTQTDAYNIRDFNTGDQLRVTANNSYKLYLSLDYQFLGLSLTIAPSVFNGDQNTDLRGESTFSDFRFRAALGQWIQGFQISSVEGYYVENTADLIQGWQEGIDPFIQIPDLKRSVYGMSTSFVFNPNFSFRNVLYQTEWQKKSAGSFIPALFYSYNKVSYTLDGVKYSEDIYPLRLAAAYYYTFVYDQNWFATINITPAGGVRFTKLDIEREGQRNIQKNTYFTSSLDGGIQLGYASRRVIFGAGISYDINGFVGEEGNFLENDGFSGVVYLGYRIEAPKFIDRAYNKFAKKVGL